MNHDKLLDIIKDGNITIPLYIYKLFPKLNIDYETFIFLMYLYSKGNKKLFDIKVISEDLALDNKKIMNYISSLESNKLIYQYGSEYLKESKESEKKYRIHSSFMNKHNLKPLSRALMVDWMIEIFYAFNSEASTFFLAVDILDRYLQYTEKNIEDKDIHLIG